MFLSPNLYLILIVKNVFSASSKNPPAIRMASSTYIEFPKKYSPELVTFPTILILGEISLLTDLVSNKGFKVHASSNLYTYRRQTHQHPSGEINKTKIVKKQNK